MTNAKCLHRFVSAEYHDFKAKLTTHGDKFMAHASWELLGFGGTMEKLGNKIGTLLETYGVYKNHLDINANKIKSIKSFPYGTLAKLYCALDKEIVNFFNKASFLERRFIKLTKEFSWSEMVELERECEIFFQCNERVSSLTKDSGVLMELLSRVSEDGKLFPVDETSRKSISDEIAGLLSMK